MQMFIAQHIIISLPNSPQSEATQVLVTGHTDKMSNVRSIENYSAIKRSAMMINVAMWMNLKKHDARWKKSQMKKTV